MKKLGAGSFQLEPDGFSIHTLEIVKKLSNKEYKRIRDSMPDDELHDLSWSSFVSAIKEPELVQYLKERNLYVNEPVEGEGEV